jgi:trimethylamine--corrinoid protein Co-methyltransferase
MRVNYQANITPQFRVLSDDQIEEILSASLEILERVGVRVEDEEGVRILKEGGAHGIGGSNVKIPAFLVKKALASAPGRIVLSGRNRKRDLVLEKDRIYFGTGSDLPFFIDPHTGKRRRTVFEDVVNAGRVADALPNIDFFMSLGIVSDVPEAHYDRHQFLAMLMGTAKPFLITSVDGKGLKDQFDMASMVVGGDDNFKQSPLFGIYAEPISPLVHPKTTVEKVLVSADCGIPLIFVPAPSAGGTAPATMAGILVEGMADTLAGLVLSQLRNPGSGFVMGGVFTSLDMRTTVFTYGSPELLLLDAALADISKFLGIPVFSTSGCSDSKVFDQQAGLEAGLSILMAAQSGASLIHDNGYLESGLQGSLDMLVLVDETVSMVKRIMRGITVNRETLAVDVIEQVGIGGNFLQEDHTLKYFKNEIWSPDIIDRHMFEGWEAGGSKTMGDRCREKVLGILKSHQPDPVLEDKMIDELKRFIAKVEEEKKK